MITGERFSCTIETTSGPFPARDFGEFLYVFRAVYVAAIDELSHSTSWNAEDTSQMHVFAESIETKMNKWTAKTFARHAARKLHEEVELRIDEIHRRNPIDLGLVAVAPALLAAVIIAGGAYQFSTKKITIPTFKAAITSIRSRTREYRYKLRMGTRRQPN